MLKLLVRTLNFILFSVHASLKYVVCQISCHVCGRTLRAYLQAAVSDFKMKQINVSLLALKFMKKIVYPGGKPVLPDTTIVKIHPVPGLCFRVLEILNAGT
jgi:hypothetical protein